MDFYYGLAQIIGVHTLLGLSAYVVLLTGQVTLAQAGFFAIGAYAAGMLTVLAGWHLVPALGVGALLGAAVACAVGLSGAARERADAGRRDPRVRRRACACSSSTSTTRSRKGEIKVGPLGGEGFRQIRYFPENGWTTLEVMLFIWVFVVLVMALLWWFDRSRYGAVLRAVGEDELAAQSVGINLTAVKVSAMTDRRRDRRHRRRHVRALHDAHRAQRTSTCSSRPSRSPTRSSAAWRASSARSPR